MSQSFPSPQEPAHQGCLGIRVQPKATSRLLLDSQDHSLPQKEHSCEIGFWFSWKDFKISKCYTGVFSGLMLCEKVLFLAGLAIPWVAVFKETKKKKPKQQNNPSQDSDLCLSAHWNIFTASAGYFEAPFANHQEGSRAPRNVTAKHCCRSTDSPTEGRVNGSEDLTCSRNEYLPLLPHWQTPQSAQTPYQVLQEILQFSISIVLS